MCPDPRRPGTSLVELTVTLVLLVGLVALLAGLVQIESRLARDGADRAEALDAVRSLAGILGGELAVLDPATDLRALSRDSLGARIFRGTGIVCASSAAMMAVRYRGNRDPDPTKDSVLILAGGGPGRVRRMVTASKLSVPPCAYAPGESVFALTLSAAADSAAIVAVFESGAYHLSTNALRYLRGASGRQPLTADVLDDSTRFASLPSDTLALSIDVVPVQSRQRRAGAMRGGRVRLRVAFLNRMPASATSAS
jgi:hypothetical protein